MNAMMRFRRPRTTEDGYDIILWGPDARKIADERGYVETGIGVPDWTAPGPSSPYKPVYQRTFPDEERIGEELLKLDGRGVQIDPADRETQGVLDQAKERQEP